MTEKALTRVREWLADPDWPQFGPGIGAGPLDAGRMAARAAAQQVLDQLADSLDAAWAEAEAALPEGHGMQLVRGTNVQTGHPSPGYRGVAFSGTMLAVITEGDSPAAALRALAAKLRE